MSGVPQGCLLGPLLICIFIDKLPDILKFRNPYIFAENFIILCLGKKREEVQKDLNSIERWLTENKMALALDKCTNLTFRGKNKTYRMCDKKLKQQTEMKNLGVMVCGKMNWSCHIENRLIKENKVLCSLWRNFAVKPFTEIGLH